MNATNYEININITNFIIQSGNCFIEGSAKGEIDLQFS